MATLPLVKTRQVYSRNPANEETLATFSCATEAEVNDAVRRARAAQPAWAALPIRRRAAVLRRFQQLLLDRKQEVARLITQEAGKPYPESILTDVLVALDTARFCARNAYSVLRPQSVPHSNLVLKAKRGRIVYEPYGVIGIIAPWNYPFSTPATETLGALIAGNAVLLKPSEFTTLTARELVALLHEAGVPEDVVQLIPGDGQTGAALVASSVDKVFFTGSVASGKRVAQAAASKLLPVVLELGGKDAMIVLDDVNLDVASSAAVWGALINAGQTCLSVERCYVHRNIYDRFVSACVEKVSKLKVGNGMDADTDLGPVIHQQQLNIIESQVEDARANGAHVLTGGRRLPELGPNFYEPTVIVDVTPEMRIMREETFGPVLVLVPVSGAEEAVNLANDSEFGLAASVWTSDRQRGEAIARQLEAGVVMVNDVVSAFAVCEAPHGGVKNSGIGRTHGKLGLLEMVRPKYVDVDMVPQLPKLWWFRYGPGYAEQMEGFTDFLFARNPLRALRGGLKSLPAMKRLFR